MANSTDPFGKQMFGGQTSLVPGGTTAAGAAPTTAAPWKSYDQFFAGDPKALSMGMYHTGAVAGSPEAQQLDSLKWGAGGNPYQYTEQYNQYTAGLPQQYQDLIHAGITPSMVQSGQVNSIVQDGKINPIQLPGGGVAGQGSGSINSMDPNVLKKMWQ